MELKKDINGKPHVAVLAISSTDIPYVVEHVGGKFVCFIPEESIKRNGVSPITEEYFKEYIEAIVVGSSIDQNKTTI